MRGFYMNKTIMKFGLIMAMLLSITACDNDINSKDPATFYSNLLQYRYKIKPEDFPKYVSAQLLQEDGISKAELIADYKRKTDNLKFAGYKLEAVKINNVYKYDTNTVIVQASIKYHIDAKSESQFSDDTGVLVLENGTWKISFYNLIKHYHYSNSCGNADKVTLCINDSYIYPESTQLVGEINNASHDNYSFGFAAPVETLMVLADNTKVYGNYPSIHP